MRAHEIGIYTILLNEMYARGHPLDLSTERLARLCGCDKRTLTSTLNMLIEEGKIIHLANGLWNKRCDSVFHERTKLLEKKSFAGRSSAQKRKKINAKIQHLLNKHTTNDTRNSEAQKIEEKETPYGVSQKKQLCPERNTFSFSSQDRPTTEDLLPNDPIFPHSRIVSTASPQFSQQQSSSLYTKGTRLPSDWIADISMAISEGLSEEQARWQEKKFRDYWKAKGGKDAVKIDWSATWRNWCRREIERLREHREKPYPVSSQLHKTHLNFREENLYQNLINYHHENYDPLS